jgi:hypothetical protein
MLFKKKKNVINLTAIAAVIINIFPLQVCILINPYINDIYLVLY